jgi:hypothetical protein
MPAGLLGTVACNDSPSSGGFIEAGVDLTVEVDATMQPAQPPPDLEGGEAGYGYGASDAYAPLAWCQQCACKGGSYCFGGSTGYTSFDGVCDNVEAGAGAPLAVGCNLPPSGCDASDCVCLIKALAPQMPCAANCVGTKNVSVYCPTP